MKYRYLSTTGVQSLLLLIASSAQAGWQETDWGMSQREVSRMFPAAVETDEGLSVAGYPVLGSEGTAVFRFNEDGLAQVRLDLDLAACRSVMKHQLVLRYGQPLTVDARQTAFSAATETFWLDQENGNLIAHVLMEREGDGACQIRYERIPEKNAVGGL